MAMLLSEEGIYDKTKIYATDINADVLEVAKSGVFPLNQMRKYTNNYIQAGGNKAFSDYYQVTNNGVKFNSELTRNVIFTQHNLVTDRSINDFHVIVCRNVMIYFDKSLQKRVHRLFYESLTTLGILGLGDKETISYTDQAGCFEEVCANQKLYKKVK